MRLLVVTAHPDDEAGGFGGTLLLSRARGVETHVLCLAAGTAATHRGGARSDAELAAMRRAEFAAACHLLQVSHAEVLDYPDGALDRCDFFAITGDLVRRIRTIRPQIVLSFGPDGSVTGHPDHGMASHFATAAFHWAGRTNRFPEQLEREGLAPHRAQKLYYQTAPFLLPDRQPVSLPPTSAILDIAPYFETKVAAFKLHTSQAPLFPLFESMVRQRGPRERFLLAAAATPRDLVLETDLFEGVTDD
jgi:LmbE family N-acetylglucosaminyl deacetylase